MKTIEENIAEIESDFSMFDQWVDKYAYLIDLGKSLPLIDAKYKDEEHLIRGCQSHRIYGRLGRYHHQRDHLPAGAGPLGTNSAGHRAGGLVVHRPHRTLLPPLAHPGQRALRDDPPDETLRRSFCRERKITPALKTGT